MHTKDASMVSSLPVWSTEHEEHLSTLLECCNERMEYYHRSYQRQKRRLSFFKVPVLILSSVSGYLAIGNSGYFTPPQRKYISLGVGFMNLLISILNGIEAFQGIQQEMILHSKTFHELYRLHEDISFLLQQPIHDRKDSGCESILKSHEKLEWILEQTTVPYRLPPNVWRPLRRTSTFPVEKHYSEKLMEYSEVLPPHIEEPETWNLTLYEEGKTL